jgi:hypothetical protein
MSVATSKGDMAAPTFCEEDTSDHQNALQKGCGWGEEGEDVYAGPTTIAAEYANLSHAAAAIARTARPARDTSA